LTRGLAVLRALGSTEALAEGGLGVVRVAAMVGAHKSQVSRTLAVLAKEGFVERSEDRSYRLGWRLYGLAAQAGDRRLLVGAGPVLDQLVATVGETAHLSVRRGTEVLTVLSRAPDRAVCAVGWAGRTVPASCSSSGRVLFMGHSREELERIFGEVSLPQPTTAAPRDATQFARRVELAARQGFAIVDEELEAGLVGIAAPIRDADGTVVAAVNISGPKFRLARRRRAVAKSVTTAAERLSAALNDASSAEPRTQTDFRFPQGSA
jgi:DNA-binding IclR family transcriptional regulator